MTAVPRPSFIKPRFRGRLHQIAFFVSIPQGLALVGVAAGAVGRIAVGTYAVSLSGVYGVSALYHRLKWSPAALGRMRRLDHSMIYLLIAGTYTAVSLLVLDGPIALGLLGLVWTGTVLGITLKLVGFERTRRLGGALYIVLGWTAVLAMPWIVANIAIVPLVLIIAGGLLYTVGSIVLLRKRPDPSPYVFGYHEVWHAMVVAAGLCHYTAILLILLSS